MNIEIFNKINIFIELLMFFRHFDFVTEERFVIVENPEHNNLWIETHKTNKDLIGGFIPANHDLYFGPTFRLSKSGRKPVNYGSVYIHHKISVTHSGIIFIRKPDILVSKGPASAEYKTDDTVDVFPKDYQNENDFEKLKEKYPDLSENMLTSIYYFCINPLPKGIQVEIDVDHIDKSIVCIQESDRMIKI